MTNIYNQEKGQQKKIGLKFPTRVSINITRQCNLRCPHCLSDSGIVDKNELTTKELFSLINQLKVTGKPILAIGGGEPLIRKDLFEVITYAKKQGIPVSIVTNSLLLTKKKAKKLDSLNLVSITISIDGLEKNHDFMRGKGNFKKAVENIKLLRKYVHTAKLNMRVTVNTYNINECKKLIRLAESLKLDTIRLTPALPIGRAKDHLDLLLNQEQYQLFLKECHKVKSNINVVLPDKNSNLLNIRKGEFGCHCGRETCWITQTGDLYPCIFYGEGYIAGNIRKEKFVDLWEKSKEMVRFCGNEYCNNCSNYKNCRGGCRARAFWKYLDINAVDPYCPLNKNKIFEKKRLPYQVLIFPFIKEKSGYLYAIFKRRDLGFWQGISGGGEGIETPFLTAKREAYEEAKIGSEFIKLDSTATIPVENIGNYRWNNVLVVPEYAFGVKVPSKNVEISNEHSEYKWLPFEEAEQLLKYDSNKTALWELNKRLVRGGKNEILNRVAKARLFKKGN